MSKEKYLSIFLRQIEATVFIILQMLLATRTVLKIGEYLSDIHIPQFWVEHIQPRDAFRRIAGEGKYLMDYNYKPSI